MQHAVNRFGDKNDQKRIYKISILSRYNFIINALDSTGMLCKEITLAVTELFEANIFISTPYS
ncbi:hypothetical protein GCM10022259_08130 [Aquimarina mytili]